MNGTLEPYSQKPSIDQESPIYSNSSFRNSFNSEEKTPKKNYRDL